MESAGLLSSSSYWHAAQAPASRNPLQWAACAAVASFGLLLVLDVSRSFGGVQLSAAQSTRPVARVATQSGFVARPVSAVAAGDLAASSSISAPQSGAEFVALPAPSSTLPNILTFLGISSIIAGAALLFNQLTQQQAGAPRVAMLSTTGEKAGESKDKMRQMVENLDIVDLRALSRGASMEDVARSRGIDEIATAIMADQASRKDLTPRDVILDMQRGNGRFWMGLSERPDMSAMERRALIIAQAPKICILSCSDSRVPVEIIFDQGLGEVFVVRMAGNILDANAHGSIEYAVKYLGVKVVLVIGHEGCGAVKGAISMSAEDISKEPFDLQVVLTNIKSNLDVKELNLITDARSRDREAIILNTSNQVKKLQQNQLIASKVADGSLMVAGAFYEISSGIVDFFSLDKNGLVVDI